jgi:hypothetical protein
MEKSVEVYLIKIKLNNTKKNQNIIVMTNENDENGDLHD